MPLMSQSTMLLCFHVIAFLLTLAVRSEYNGCPITKTEGDTKKIYKNVIIDNINFNVLFFVCGCVSLFRICFRKKKLFNN